MRSLRMTAATPSPNAPVILTTKVATGKPPAFEVTARPTHHRSNAPSAPPVPTAKDFNFGRSPFWPGLLLLFLLARATQPPSGSDQCVIESSNNNLELPPRPR